MARTLQIGWIVNDDVDRRFGDIDFSGHLNVRVEPLPSLRPFLKGLETSERFMRPLGAKVA